MRTTISTVIDWVLFLIVMGIIASILIGLPSVRADEASDRVAVAIAIHNATDNPWFPLKPPPAPPPPQPPKAGVRSVVFVAYAPFKCPPCDIQKADLAGWVPGEFAIETPAKFPVEIPFYPYTTWQDEDGKWWYLPKWDGKADLLGRWKATRKTKVRSASGLTAAELRAFAASYRGPTRDVKKGNYYGHLLTEHGFAAWQLAGLSQAECVQIHGGVHYGYLTATGINR